MISGRKEIVTLKADANRIREVIKEVGNDVQTFKTCVQVTQKANPESRIDFGEAIANVMLAYHHLEDARMRVGKCIQALDGGVSIYDRRPPQQQQQ